MRERTVLFRIIHHSHFQHIQQDLSCYLCRYDLIVKRKNRENIIECYIACCHWGAQAAAVDIGDFRTCHYAKRIRAKVAKIRFSDSYKTVFVLVMGDKIYLAFTDFPATKLSVALVDLGNISVNSGVGLFVGCGLNQLGIQTVIRNGELADVLKLRPCRGKQNIVSTLVFHGHLLDNQMRMGIQYHIEAVCIFDNIGNVKQIICIAVADMGQSNHIICACFFGRVNVCLHNLIQFIFVEGVYDLTVIVLKLRRIRRCNGFGGSDANIGNIHITVRNNSIRFKVGGIFTDPCKITGKEFCVRHFAQLGKPRKLIVKLVISQSNGIIAHQIHQIHDVLAF